MHALRVLEAAIRGGYATRAVWSDFGRRLIASSDPIEAWQTELHLAEAAGTALAIVSATCDALASPVEPSIELELGFLGLRISTGTLPSPEEFRAELNRLVAVSPDPILTSRLASALDSLNSGTPVESACAALTQHLAAFTDRAQLEFRHVVPHTVEELLDMVQDHSTLTAFVHALSFESSWAEQLGAHSPHAGLGAPLGWQNASIADFLDAAASFSREIPEPSWRSFAEFLYGGKVCE
jgi:hypothetical protein